MKHLLNATAVVAIAALCFMPRSLFAAGDTLTVYASGPTLDVVILGDTLGNGTRAHHVYWLPTVDTTYIVDGTITVTSDVAVIGVPTGSSKRLPCIQPDVVGGNIPVTLFSMNGNNTKATFKNLYLLGLAVNNSANLAGVAIQVSADNVRLATDNVVFEEWLGFAIGYNGNSDKFLITNCKFRNMNHANQWYVGEVLRNEYPGSVPTDSIVFRYNTIFCVNGYAAAPVSKALVSYFEFSHNNVVYTFKNPFFIHKVTNAKIDNNIFYCNYAGGQNIQEYSGNWDEFTQAIGSVISLDTLDATLDTLFDPADVSNANLRWLAEAKRNVEVKNNVYFWPAAITSFWTAWNDTAHVDSVYTPQWMNSRTVGMFTDKTHWPNFVQSGNQNADPGFGASIPNVLTQSTNGLLAWFALIRTAGTPTAAWDYQKTAVGTGIWVPPWPLPESADMQYTNTAVKNSATDALPLGDPYWFTGVPTSVKQLPGVAPAHFALSQAYPNPFNPSTNIMFTLDKSGQTTLKVYNVLGQAVRTIVDGYKPAGQYNVRVDMSGLSSGVYFSVLQQGQNRMTQKMVLLK